jgi:hypothetical protein
MEERPSKHFAPARRNIGRRPWLPGQPNQSAALKRRSLKWTKTREIERFPSHPAFVIICFGLQRRSLASANSPKNNE